MNSAHLYPPFYVMTENVKVKPWGFKIVNLNGSFSMEVEESHGKMLCQNIYICNKADFLGFTLLKLTELGWLERICNHLLRREKQDFQFEFQFWYVPIPGLILIPEKKINFDTDTHSEHSWSILNQVLVLITHTN